MTRKTEEREEKNAQRTAEELQAEMKSLLAKLEMMKADNCALNRTGQILLNEAIEAANAINQKI